VLGPIAKHSGCKIRGALPDRGCTPGAILPAASVSRICQRGYSRRVRHVSYQLKGLVYRAYGVHRRFDGGDGEVDHLVPLELGGSNQQANLWPERATPAPGAHEKDAVENFLHGAVCERRMELRTAQRQIARDWLVIYRRLGPRERAAYDRRGR
jgi:hypothetical protein